MFRTGWCFVNGLLCAAVLLNTSAACAGIVLCAEDECGVAASLEGPVIGEPSGFEPLSSAIDCLACAIHLLEGHSHDWDAIPHVPELGADDMPVGLTAPQVSPAQATGAGSAAVVQLVAVPENSLRMLLPLEGRNVLPKGPVYRWFRPPRS